MKRFEHFTDDQAHELARARKDDYRRVALLATLLVCALALGFGYGLNRVSEASDHADAASRAAAQVIRDRALDAKKIAEETTKKAAENARTAYAACRRQQESTHAARVGVKVVLADPDPRVHHLALQYRQLLDTQHLLDIPDCPKPPKGS